MTSPDSEREALLVLDATLKVRAANKAFYTMFRLAPEECVGRKVYELGGRAWDEKLRPMLETVLSGEPQSDHFELIHDDKEGGHGVLWINARLVPSTDAADATILVAIEDLTAGRTVEETLAIKVKELNTFADLAGRTAHEMNNLLTVIRMNADLIESTLVQSKLPATEAAEVRDAAERAESLTRKLLVTAQGVWRRDRRAPDVRGQVEARKAAQARRADRSGNDPTRRRREVPPETWEARAFRRRLSRARGI